jgi:hypothetical protein
MEPIDASSPAGSQSNPFHVQELQPSPSSHHSSKSSQSVMEMVEENTGPQSPTYYDNPTHWDDPTISSSQPLLEDTKSLSRKDLPLTFGDFCYSMEVTNKRIEALYTFCHYFRESQKEIAKNI